MYKFGLGMKHTEGGVSSNCVLIRLCTSTIITESAHIPQLGSSESEPEPEPEPEPETKTESGPRPKLVQNPSSSSSGQSGVPSHTQQNGMQEPSEHP